MNRHQKLLWAAVGLVGVVCLLWLAVAATLLWAVLSPEDWASVTAGLGGRVGLLLFLWALALIPIHAALKALIDRHLRAPAQLAEAVRLRLDSDVSQDIDVGEHPETRVLADLFNEILAERRAAEAEREAQLAEAVQATESERARLSALMSELNRSVVVCNLEGRVLLYNNRARLQFKRLSNAGHVTGGNELMGIGRSIYTVLDRRQVSHALDTLNKRLSRGANAPSAQFVTATDSGKLYRVHMSPVRIDEQAMTGFVLIIENITEDMQANLAKDELINRLVLQARERLATLRMASSVLKRGGLKASDQSRVQEIISTHIERLSEELTRAPQQSAQALLRRWPLEDMLAEDLLETLQHQLQTTLGLDVHIDQAQSDQPLWLKVESYALLQGLMALSDRLHRECGMGTLSLEAFANTEHAQLSLIWPTDNTHSAPDLSWEHMPVAEDSQITLHTIVNRHNGSLWLEDHADHSRFCLRLPLAAPQDELPDAWLQRHDARPEFYDFDLFQSQAQHQALHEQPLSALSLTVFDTETTGLRPSEGDEIIQIGAVRVVNGKLLRKECFDQLVDPQRSIPSAGIAIHGITPDQLQGQPTIAEVLPAFHAFCNETVLVAHNAAFDMKCLQMKQAQTGVVFDHPVLDTLLLSALAHPNHPTHNLDDVAQRFGLTIVGRHSAMGDAMVTAEIMVRLIPALASQGVVTLGQALAASEQVWQARVSY